MSVDSAYPQVVDEGFHLADALRQSRVPTTLVVDGDGAIVHVGLALDQAAVGALEAALRRADADGHCKSNRLAGLGSSEPDPRTIVARPLNFVATMQRTVDASATGRSAETSLLQSSGVEYIICSLVGPCLEA